MRVFTRGVSSPSANHMGTVPQPGGARKRREGLAYCLLGSGCRDGSVGRDGAGGVGLEGAGCRVGSGSRSVISPSPSAWPLRSSTGLLVCGPLTRFSLSVLRSRRRLYPTRPGLVCARLHMASKHGRQISFPLHLQPQSSAHFAPEEVQFLSERKKSGSSRDSALAATSISGSGILYDLRSRRAHRIAWL